jgi:hypothetical protein
MAGDTTFADESFRLTIVEARRVSVAICCAVPCQ